MAKRSRTSRSERKAERERAAHAREHGLPVAEPSPAAVGVVHSRAADEPDALDSSAPRAATRRQSPPALVWVVGGGLAILVAVYVLSRLRAP